MKRVITKTRNGRREVLGAMAFVAWSAAMVLIGTVVAEVGFTRSYAGEMAVTVTPVRLDHARLDGKGLGEFEPYEPEHGNLNARGHQFFQSEDGNFTVGVWEARPGEMAISEPYPEDELMYVLAGKIVLIDDQDNQEVYGPGEGVIMPKGWTGTFSVPEGVRKIWVSYEGRAKE